MSKFIDLTGKVFGRLTVIERAEDRIYPSGQKQTQWVCKCSCVNQNTVIVSTNSLNSGQVKSCGCLQKESMIKNGKARHMTNKYDLSNDYGIGVTTNTELEFYFDKSDYNIIKDICWNSIVDHSGYTLLIGYNTETGKRIKFTHIIGCAGYDHINRNPLDCRRSNLRKCTSAENARNRGKQKSNTSGIVGVNWNKKQGKWMSRINDTVGHRICLGLFNDKDDAIRARLQAEIKYYGEFAPQQHLYEKYGINNTH